MAYGTVNEAWIVGAVRTPIGRHGGALAAVRPDDLGALVLEALMERAGVPSSELEDVYMGCANQAGEDNRNVARMSLLLAGFPEGIAGATVNRLCGSGLEAVAGAARAVMLGEADVYVGSWVESMSRAPWSVPKPSRAYPTGHTTMYDTTLDWRFVNPRMEKLGHTDSLGVTAENLAEERFRVTAEEQKPEELAAEYDVSRQAQDRFALRSHQKARVLLPEFSFLTLKPGSVPGPDGRSQAPHVMVFVFARGLLRPLVSRIYFPDEEEANVADPVLSSIEDLELRNTLIACEEGGALRFDVRLQGDEQTAFFEFAG